MKEVVKDGQGRFAEAGKRAEVDGEPARGNNDQQKRFHGSPGGECQGRLF